MYLMAPVPECSSSKKEKHIGSLIERCVKYDKICRHGPLIYANNRKYIPDFYLEIGNNKIIIEYNGMQHYETVRFGGISHEKAKIKFDKQQKRDEELRKYCIVNNIFLLEIPYYQKDEETLTQLTLLNKLI